MGSGVESVIGVHWYGADTICDAVEAASSESL